MLGRIHRLSRVGAVLPLVAIGALIVLASAAGCGSTTTPEQQAAINKVHDLGGRLNFKNGGYEIDFTGTQVEDDDLAVLKNIPKVQTLDLQGTRISDKGLDHIKAIDALQIVLLSRTIASREGIEALKTARPNVDVRY